MTSAFSVAVLGLGQIGFGYDRYLDPALFVYTHARAFGRHPRFRLVAGLDPDARQRDAFTSETGVPAFADIESLSRSAAVDLAVIAAPTHAHRDMVHATLQHVRPRAILCEKPLAYASADAQVLVAECRKAEVALFVNYMRRADPGVAEVRRRLHSGEIQPPCKGVIWYSKGFLHNGSHFYDLATHWLGPVLRSRVIDAGRAWGAADREPDVSVEFERGAMTFLAAREEAFSHYTIELLAANGRLRYERGGERIEWWRTVPHPRLHGYTVLDEQPECIATGMKRYQWHVADQLATALDGGTHDLCTGDQALQVLESMNSLMEQL